jgi:GT2 family glycosyltransferase
MKIGYVCTNYNNSSYTRAAVRTLVADPEHEYRVVIVDNASDQDAVAGLRALQADHAQVHLILNRENVGYFRGLNQGIRYLRTEHPEIDWMAVGNNDLEFPSGFARSLEAHSVRLSAHAVISPDIVTVDGVHQNPHVISHISKVREAFYDLYFSNYYVGLLVARIANGLRTLSDRSDETEWQVARPIYQGHGSCYLLGPRFFQQFEELWAPTFLMSEEYFLSKQLSDVGQQVFYEPAIQVIHHYHATLRNIPSKQRWALARNAHREYRKYVKVVG